MQISRLFEIVYLLLDRKMVTASELAERFEVSTRTVYRDVDTLAQAGIPIYAERGRGGGIRLTENFVLAKSALTDDERQGVLSALQAMAAAGATEADAALGKLSALFGESEDWVELDYAAWNPEDPAGAKFQLLKEAILARRAVSFRYSAAGGGTLPREAEPHKLIFRGYDWYLLAWCRLRGDFRYFKLSRMEDLTDTGAPFRRRPLPPPAAPSRRPEVPTIGLTLRFHRSLAYRVLEEFSPEQREALPDGGFRVRVRLPDNDWLYQGLLTYGGAMRVEEPAQVREELARRHRAGFQNNESEDTTMELKQIASFQVDHTKLTEGMYTSRVDGDVVTYDIRMKRPNQGDYLGSAAIHTIEHLFATYVRSGPWSDRVIYAGPMGCRTGFYFLVRDLAPNHAIALVRDTMTFIAGYDGPIPGATERECGNYREQDLPAAKAECAHMAEILKDWTESDLKYDA